MSPYIQSIGPVIDTLAATEYALPLDAYPVAQEPAGSPPCQTTTNLLNGETIPSEPFYSPSKNQYYCGPVQYAGQQTSSGISSGWILAGVLAAAGLWWYFGGAR